MYDNNNLHGTQYTSDSQDMQEVLIRTENLTKSFRRMSAHGKKERFPAVKDVSFSIQYGEIVGLLGESGCGKTTLARMLMGLEKPEHGKVFWKNEEIQNLPERQFRPLRRELQMILQNPFACLDPHMSIHRSLMEVLKIWKIGDNAADREERILSILEECGMNGEILKKRPSEFSGGQLQRIAIARSLLLEPQFLVADEIVSALDVSVQNQILELLLEQKGKRGLTILFITHDLAVVQRLSDRVMVMREGELLSGYIKEEYLGQLKEAVFPVLS